MNTHTVTGEHARNRCLGALSEDALALLKPHLKTIIVDAGAVLWEAGWPQQHVYFPASGLLSITLPMNEVAMIEIASVGRGGAAGALDDVASGRPVTRAVVLMGGAFTQIDADVLAELARQNREIDSMVRHCRDWLLAQAQQLAACNATHSADKRLCRWLTTCQQRVDGDRIYATQEQIGALLGIRRTTVTLLAQKLQEQGLIDYSRGRISVRDAAGLEAAACECCGNLGRAQWPSARQAAMKAVPVG